MTDVPCLLSKEQEMLQKVNLQATISKWLEYCVGKNKKRKCNNTYSVWGAIYTLFTINFQIGMTSVWHLLSYSPWGNLHWDMGASTGDQTEYLTSFSHKQSGKPPPVVTKIKWPSMVPKMNTGTTGSKNMLPEKVLHLFLLLPQVVTKSSFSISALCYPISAQVSPRSPNSL